MNHLLWLLLLCCFSASAQTAKEDVVYLRNGAVIKGSIMSYQPGENLVIDIGEGRQVTFTAAEILRVAQAVPVRDDDPSTVDIVYLFNGSIFKGKIRYETSHNLVLELNNGEQLSFHAKEIREVHRKQPVDAIVERPAHDFKYISASSPKARKVKSYDFRERGWFNVTSFALPNGFYFGEPQLGIGLHNLTGFQFNRLLGLGLGLGFDAFNIQQGEYIASVYGEARSYPAKSRTAPFASFGAGYGFGFPNEQTGITKAQGGFRWHPALGLRLGADKDLNLVIDAGYIFQTATYTREIEFLNRTEIRKVDFRRFTLRLGAMF